MAARRTRYPLSRTTLHRRFLRRVRWRQPAQIHPPGQHQHRACPLHPGGNNGTARGLDRHRLRLRLRKALCPPAHPKRAPHPDVRRPRRPRAKPRPAQWRPPPERKTAVVATSRAAASSHPRPRLPSPPLNIAPSRHQTLSRTRPSAYPQPNNHNANPSKHGSPLTSNPWTEAVAPRLVSGEWPTSAQQPRPDPLHRQKAPSERTLSPGPHSHPK